jgi:hypothetical protein
VDNEQVTKDAAEAAGGKKKKGIGVNFKVSAKGAVSVYGLGRFPVTHYREQCLRLLERTDELKAFLEEHAEELKAKGEATTEVAEVAPAAAPESATTTPSGGAEGGEAQATPEAVRDASQESAGEAKAATETGTSE